MGTRFLGCDIGAETIKVVELTRTAEGLTRTRQELVEHGKEPARALIGLLEGLGWTEVDSAAVSGRFARLVRLPRVPIKQAQARGVEHLRGARPTTVVSIGAHGFSVLERRESGTEVFRENSRCSQGTGNFLRQLVARFDLSIEAASALCEEVADPAPLSGRCPVILKTDMTHLANKGESQARILAGLYDAVCENVQVLIKPRLSPPEVMLAGGVTRSRRVRERFSEFLVRHNMQLLDGHDEDAIYLEALGAALIAAEHEVAPPSLETLLAPPEEVHLDRVPSLRESLDQVERMPRPPVVTDAESGRPLVLGFDIGSTGSKVVAVDATSRAVAWEGYINTNGNPVSAAQTLMRKFVESDAARRPVIAVAATGSGREIVGSLLSTCYGCESVYVLNEIAAHAEGALHFDARVDTIFEIGGQDAKYIRLSDGRVVDAAMNEACSAGTGSFIEEQGRKFAGVKDVVQLGQEALSSCSGVSLGQHCSVFMAEIIDEAVASGVESSAIIAGTYDSVVQNYLNRVKGSRSVGQVIFCQGMPFSADALAAAVVRQTGSKVIVPPNPGTVGALGIALLALKHLPLAEATPIQPARFLEARLTGKDTFVCKSKKGCGGTGNRCRIDRLTTLVDGERQRFTWGGACSLWDKGTGKRKLPDGAPDPFREREELRDEIVARLSVPRGGKRVAISDAFQLKGLLPFFARYLAELGFDLMIETNADHATLKRGIEQANIPFCAPMQQFHGMVTELAERKPDLLLLPMMRTLPRVGDEPNAVVCPIVQGSPDMLKWDLGRASDVPVVSPVIDFGPGNLESKAFIESCHKMAAELGVVGTRWWRAYEAALLEQNTFDMRCKELGARALAFCREHELTAVVVLGRPYTLYNTVLNSNVPAILREQGSVPIPVDCYGVTVEAPVFHDVFWGHGQRNLRAAHQIRHTPGVYSLWCSNYSCGPDSFNLHFYAYLMQGKPFSVIETDGHSGDAGTKTRVEAFLHCVREDLSRARAAGAPTTVAQLPRASALKSIEHAKATLPEIRARGERVLVPRMGAGAEGLAACLRGIGVAAEALPQPDRETVRIGRRHTSGKECVPMTITLGSLLQRIEPEKETNEKFAFFMPTACGPCRFGVYNVLHKIVLERLGWQDRVRVWSPVDSDYFEGVPAGFAALVFTGFASMDMLLDALYDVRPVERRPGAAQEIYERYKALLLERLEQAGRGDLSVPAVLLQVGSGRIFGCADLLRSAAVEFARVKSAQLRPSVMMVGEIYVRCDPFANDFMVEQLEQRGIRVRFAPFTEWLEYSDHLARVKGLKAGFGAQLSSFVQRRILNRAYALMAAPLAWPERLTVKDTIEAASPYLRDDLFGEAVLTVGGPVHEWRAGLIDGVVSVGPLECMPNKISEAQFFHVAEEEGLLSLTLPLNGDPIDPVIVDNFAFEVQSRFRKRQEAARRAGAWAPGRALTDAV